MFASPVHDGELMPAAMFAFNALSAPGGTGACGNGTTKWGLGESAASTRLCSAV